MGFREIKNKARTLLHDKLKVRAFYYLPGSTSDPQDVTVRVHTKLNKEQGDLKGTSFSYAETEQHIPAILFWLPDGMTLTNKAVVMISAEEGYRVNHFREPDGLSQIGEVVVLNATERARYSYPGAV